MEPKNWLCPPPPTHTPWFLQAFELEAVEGVEDLPALVIKRPDARRLVRETGWGSDQGKCTRAGRRRGGGVSASCQEGKLKPGR